MMESRRKDREPKPEGKQDFQPKIHRHPVNHPVSRMCKMAQKENLMVLRWSRKLGKLGVPSFSNL